MTIDPNDRRRSMDKWRITKEISLADMISLVSAVIAIVYVYGKLDGRITFLEAMEAGQRATDERQDLALKELQLDIRQELKSINEKLFKMIEKSNATH